MIVIVLKNRINKIRSNEIRIRQELPVFLLVRNDLGVISCVFYMADKLKTAPTISFFLKIETVQASAFLSLNFSVQYS